MITRLQKDFLQRVLNGASIDRRERHGYNKRIQAGIDEGFDMMEWMAEFTPDVLNDFETEYDDPTLPRRRRMMRLAQIIKRLAGDDIDKVIIELVKEKKML